MQKEVNDYLHTLLKEFKPYLLTEEDQKKTARDKAEFLTEKLALSKYRKRKLASTTRQAIYNKVNMSIEQNRPLHFVIPFGGYKHFWNPSHPEPDWAELFNFRYLTEYVSPVLAIHEPGVIIEYVSEDMIMTRMDNYPRDVLETYARVFKELINWYNKQTPNNLDFRYFRVGDRCDKEKIIQIVEGLLPERRAMFDKLSQNEKDRELHRSKRSFYWDGEFDFTHLDDEEKYNKIVESRLIELAYYETEGLPEFLGDYLSNDEHICILFSFGTTPDNDEFQGLTLGSTYGSLVDHWIGRGVLEKRESQFFPRIVSKQQYEDAKENIIEVIIEELLPFKNYKFIDVVDKR